MRDSISDFQLTTAVAFFLIRQQNRQEPAQ